MANATIMGLGPVGLASAWQLLQEGVSVDAYDRDADLTERLQQGDFYRAEEISTDLRAKLGARLHIHSRLSALPLRDTVLVCVGTPMGENGFNLTGLLSALGFALAPKGSSLRRHFIVRSTLSPGTIAREVLPLLAKGEEFDLSYFPEFLREKSVRTDTLYPPLSVAVHSSDSARARFLRLFPQAATELPNFESAEALKLACNAFHALKVVFANEVNELCERTGASGEAVMAAFSSDTTLNISPKYLVPGKPFGGHCLKKDLQALEMLLDQKQLSSELLRSISASNERHFQAWEKREG